MSTFDFEHNLEDDQPIAHSIEHSVPRSRLVTTGKILEVETLGAQDCFTYRCLFSDESGRLDLLFVGRKRVPGLEVGALCTIEGVVGRHHGKPSIINPFYKLLAEN